MQTRLQEPAYFELMPIHGLRKEAARIMLENGHQVRFRQGGLEVVDPKLLELMESSQFCGTVYRKVAFNPFRAAARAAAADAAKAKELAELRAEVTELRRKVGQRGGWPKGKPRKLRDRGQAAITDAPGVEAASSVEPE